MTTCRSGRGSGTRLVWPFHQLQPGAGKQIAKARVFPFLWVIEAVEIKVIAAAMGLSLLFHNRIAGAFDAAFKPQARKGAG